MSAARSIKPLMRALFALAAVVALTAFLSAALSRQAGAATAGGKRPNIVVIQTDDQTVPTLSHKTMPVVTRQLVQKGTTFTNYMASTPLCCPSRASLLTGEYSHNHGVRSNVPGYADLKKKRNTLPVWLERAGYKTLHVGKYLNNYPDAVNPPTKVAPGWDQWFTQLEPFAYFGYDLSANGRLVHHGHRRRDYLTDVLSRKSTHLAKRFARKHKPFYLELDQFAPHNEKGNSGGKCGGSAIPKRHDFRRFRHEPLPQPPSFNEQDMSDKPPFMQRLHKLSRSTIKEIRIHYRCRLATLPAADRGFKELYRAIKRSGELHKTIFVFTDDNGFLQGEHRIPGQKGRPYEEAVRVPLVIRAPSKFIGADSVSEVNEPVANVDLAPTILDLANAKPCRAAGECRVMDGRSLAGLLGGSASGWPQDRGILLEYKAGRDHDKPTVSCKFKGIRTQDHLYVRHTSVPDPQSHKCQKASDIEFYDLGADPFELKNLDPVNLQAQTEQDLANRLKDLSRCAGIAGRDPHVHNRPHCE
jgi:N-acetylglucosamine-6-sulfatase